MNSNQLESATVKRITFDAAARPIETEFTVRVGDWVEFKCDIEQAGRITKITQRDHWASPDLHLEGNFIGDYIGGQTATVIPAKDCWTMSR